jgi:hypothetical protein
LELPHGFVRAAGAIGGAGGLLFAALGIYGAAAKRVEYHQGPDLWYALASIALLMFIVGVIGLGRAGFAGRGPASLIGLGGAIFGLALTFVAHAIAAADATQSESNLFPIAMIVNPLTMLFLGVLVLRTRRWRGWQQVTPLVCALYPLALVVGVLVFASDGPPGFPFIAGFGLCWLLFGMALYTAPAQRAQG